MSIDNSDFRLKVDVRQKGLSLVRPPYNVLELYAGTGMLTNHLWAKVAERVLSIEKDPHKFNSTFKNVTAITDHNANHIDKAKDFNVIDCDAYGMVLPVVLKCIEAAKENSIVFFTEFNPVRYKNDWIGETVKAVSSHKKVKGFWFHQANNSQVIYAYAQL